MADSRNLIFLSQLKQFNGDDSYYTANDETYKMAISATTSLFESITRRTFLKQDYVEILDSIDTTGQAQQYIQTLYLSNWPISKTDPFKVSIKIPYTDTYQELDVLSYTVNYENGSICLTYPTYGTRKNIKIEYSAGYLDSVFTGEVENLLDTAQERALGLHIPSDLKLAALQQSALYSVFIQASLCNDKKKNVFATGKSFNDVYNLNPASMLILSKYKRQFIKMV